MKLALMIVVAVASAIALGVGIGHAGPDDIEAKAVSLQDQAERLDSEGQDEVAEMIDPNGPDAIRPG